MSMLRRLVAFFQFSSLLSVSIVVMCSSRYASQRMNATSKKSKAYFFIFNHPTVQQINILLQLVYNENGI